jgi:hypothetical protein
MSRIVRHGALSKMEVKEIKGTIDAYGLNLSLGDQNKIALERDKEGKIAVDKQKIWTILRLLDDDYLSSSWTGIKYEARSKRERRL